jgi:hypothetical protein
MILRIALLSLVLTASAATHGQAQVFTGSYAGDSVTASAVASGNLINGRGFQPVLGLPLTPNTATDYVSMGRIFTNGSNTAMATELFLPLSSFASANDLARTNARIDQAFQQFQETNRGIAAVAAMANTWMPSAPGRTTWAINGAAFSSEIGGGISFAHRLNLSVPIAVTVAYGNGGGTAHVGRVGLMGEF